MADRQAKLTNGAQPPDLAILLAASYRVVADRLLAAMRSGGIEGMKPLYGFVIRAVAAEEPTISRLAELLGVTKQAASVLADGMCADGFLDRRTDAQDRRRARLALSVRGRAVFARATRTSSAMERELVARVGAADVAALRRALLSFVEAHGALDDVMARRARPVL
jgi:DNA-binding MarR family transcriptional regulator